MNIGIDLDGTILKTDEFVLNDLNQYYGSKYKQEDIYCPHIEKALCMDREVVKMFVKTTLNLTHLIKPIDGIPYYFNKISSANDVSIISRRDPDLYGITKMALDKLGLNDYLLYLTLGKKSDIINAKDIKVMVEDSNEEIDEIIKNSDCQAILIDRPWNRDYTDNHRIPVRTWEEAYEAITTIQTRQLDS